MGAAGFDSKTLRTDFLHRLNRVIAFDAAWFALCDPATLLFTDAVRQAMSQESTHRFVEDDILRADSNQWVGLSS